jgi:hypothetical protein
MTPQSARPTAATVVRGTAAGAVAFVVGYLLAYATGVGAANALLNGFLPYRDAGAHLAPAWKVAGWLFYDAHFAGTLIGGQTTVLVSQASVEYLFLVPPALLLLAGGAVAIASGAEGPRAGFVAGLTVTVGYALLAVLGLLVVQWAGIGPLALRALVIAGVVYPVAFGAAGGALVGVVRAGSGAERGIERAVR